MFLKKTIPALIALGAIAGISDATAAGLASSVYKLYYQQESQSVQPDETVSFSYTDSYYLTDGTKTAAQVAIKDISRSVTNTTVYYNVAHEETDGSTTFLSETVKNIVFSTKKTNTSWLRLTVKDGDILETKAVSQNGFRVATASGSSVMTAHSDHRLDATVPFNGTDKTFSIHYGSVNTETDLGAITGTYSVSPTCTEAYINYEFANNEVTITETKWGIPTVSPGSDDRARCFIDNVDDKTVTFIFDNTLWKVSGLNKIEVRGSFTGWASDAKFAMTYDSDGDFWHVTVPYADVKIPGNSGQPEFKFVYNGSSYLDGGSRSFIPEGYVFLNGDKNNIVVFDSDDFDTIKANSKTANALKSVSDFDLTTEVGQQSISNFRQVPGTTRLFRSYHPYKYTKTTNPTEPVRLDYLTRQAVEKGIMCDICLSENETNSLTSYNISGKTYTEKIPDYYQSIISNNCVLYVGATTKIPTYNAVYYTPDNDRFGTWVKEIVEFIIDDNHPAPFMIHCRIGTDRTGMFSGVLAALCGAKWTEIAADYQLTNRMGIQEFRDYHLLQYGFQKLLSVEDINDVQDLRDAMQSYFVGKGFLTDSQVDRLRDKLTGSSDVDIIQSAVTGQRLTFDPTTASLILSGSEASTVEIYIAAEHW